MNTAIRFVEHPKGFAAQGQEFLVRRQRHGSILRSVLLPSITEATRRRDIFGQTASLAPATRQAA
jgi:hypothetical protein